MSDPNCDVCGKPIERWVVVRPMFRNDYVICKSDSGKYVKYPDLPLGSHTGHFCKDGQWKSSSG